MLVSADVQESAAVTFDSYPKDDKGTVRESKYRGRRVIVPLTSPLCNVWIELSISIFNWLGEGVADA